MSQTRHSTTVLPYCHPQWSPFRLKCYKNTYFSILSSYPRLVTPKLSQNMLSVTAALQNQNYKKGKWSSRKDTGLLKGKADFSVPVQVNARLLFALLSLLGKGSGTRLEIKQQRNCYLRAYKFQNTFLHIFQVLCWSGIWGALLCNGTAFPLWGLYSKQPKGWPLAGIKACVHTLYYSIF